MNAQAEAGIEHIITQGLYWDIAVDPATGAMLNPCFLNHRFPSSADLPLDKYKTSILEGTAPSALRRNRFGRTRVFQLYRYL